MTVVYTSHYMEEVQTLCTAHRDPRRRRAAGRATPCRTCCAGSTPSPGSVCRSSRRVWSSGSPACRGSSERKPPTGVWKSSPTTSPRLLPKLAGRLRRVRRRADRPGPGPADAGAGLPPPDRPRTAGLTHALPHHRPQGPPPAAPRPAVGGHPRAHAAGADPGARAVARRGVRPQAGRPDPRLGRGRGRGPARRSRRLPRPAVVGGGDRRPDRHRQRPRRADRHPRRGRGADPSRRPGGGRRPRPGLQRPRPAVLVRRRGVPAEPDQPAQRVRGQPRRARRGGATRPQPAGRQRGHPTGRAGQPAAGHHPVDDRAGVRADRQRAVHGQDGEVRPGFNLLPEVVRKSLGGGDQAGDQELLQDYDFEAKTWAAAHPPADPGASGPRTGRSTRPRASASTAARSATRSSCRRTPSRSRSSWC